MQKMEKNWKHPEKSVEMDDLGEPPFKGNLHIYIYTYIYIYKSPNEAPGELLDLFIVGDSSGVARFRISTASSRTPKR